MTDSFDSNCVSLSHPKAVDWRRARRRRCSNNDPSVRGAAAGAAVSRSRTPRRRPRSRSLGRSSGWPAGGWAEGSPPTGVSRSDVMSHCCCPSSCWRERRTRRTCVQPLFFLRRFTVVAGDGRLNAADGGKRGPFLEGWMVEGGE